MNMDNKIKEAFEKHRLKDEWANYDSFKPGYLAAIEARAVQVETVLDKSLSLSIKSAEKILLLHEQLSEENEASKDKYDWNLNHENAKIKLLQNKLVEAEKYRLIAENQRTETYTVCVNLQLKLKVAVTALEESVSLISSTSYTEENGKRCMDGNEYVWIDRALSGMKQALSKIRG